MFVVFGAQSFSSEITVHIIGTEVPCSDNVSRKVSIYHLCLNVWDRYSGSSPHQQQWQQSECHSRPPEANALLRLAGHQGLQPGILFETPGPATQSQMQAAAKNGNDTILVFDFRYHRVGLGSGVASTSPLTSSSRYNPAVPVGSV